MNTQKSKKNCKTRLLPGVIIAILLISFISLQNVYSQVTEVTEGNFNTNVIQKEGYVLVDFYATWCGPCKYIAPIISEISYEYYDLKVCKVDVDKNEYLCQELGITSMPTVILFKDGEIVKIIVGARSKSDYMKILSDFDIS